MYIFIILLNHIRYIMLLSSLSDINECSEYFGICQNGGQCFNSIGGYTCQCALGWTGQNCTEGLSNTALCEFHVRLISLPWVLPPLCGIISERYLIKHQL